MKLAIFPAIIVGINCTSYVREHDIHDGDNRKALLNLMEDFISNMQQLRLRNLTVNEIHMKDDSRIKYNHIKTIKLPNNVKMVSTKIHGQCDLNNNLKVSISKYLIVNRLKNSYKFDTIHLCSRLHFIYLLSRNTYVYTLLYQVSLYRFTYHLDRIK